MARGPLLLSADDAKELFGEYSASHRSRSLHSYAVHEASTRIIDALWVRALAIPSPQGADAVLLVGGGVASGKTTALSSNPAVLALMQQVAIVREGTLANPKYSAAHIAQARAAGRPVEVLYVYAPIDLAVERVVDRGMRIGRAVPADAMANSHWTSQQTILQLAERYRQDPQVRFRVLISGESAQSDGRLLSIEALRQRRFSIDPRFSDQAGFRRYVQSLLQRELRRRFLDAKPADPSPQLRQLLAPRSGS